MNNRRLLIAAVFHFVHPVEKEKNVTICNETAFQYFFLFITTLCTARYIWSVTAGRCLKDTMDQRESVKTKTGKDRLQKKESAIQ